jgi:hypothetical protein
VETAFILIKARREKKRDVEFLEPCARKQRPRFAPSPPHPTPPVIFSPSLPFPSIITHSLTRSLSLSLSLSGVKNERKKREGKDVTREASKGTHEKNGKHDWYHR